MRLDLVIPNDGPYMLEAVNSAPHFEDMGWEGLWLTDHLVGHDEHNMHDHRWTEILIAMTHMAAITKRIRIGAGVLVLPYRNPLVTAKMLASMDHLSGGRIDLGVGVGNVKREYKAVSRIDIYEQRGAFSDETLDVMLTCWKGGKVEFHGKWFDFEEVVFAPAPLHDNRLPIWVGATTIKEAPLRRAAKYANFWHPSVVHAASRGVTPQTFREGGERLDELAGRKVPRTIRMRCDGVPSAVVDTIHQFKEAGCVQAACSLTKSSPTFAAFDRNVEAFFKAAQSLKG